jgi:hypothetical protein
MMGIYRNIMISKDADISLKLKTKYIFLALYLFRHMGSLALSALHFAHEIT